MLQLLSCLQLKWDTHASKNTYTLRQWAKGFSKSSHGYFDKSHVNEPHMP